MAAIRLRPGHPQRAGIFDIIGRNSASGYVGHVGILRTGNVLSYNAPVKIFHSGPPLEVGQARKDSGEPVLGEVEVHTVGWIDDLKIEEWRGIQSWIEDVGTRISSGLLKQYLVDPPFYEEPDKVSGRIMRCQYSCVGFVLRCYEIGVGITLLNIDSANLPPVDEDTLSEIYGDIWDRIGRVAPVLGIPGPGPWRIVLAGYVFHALNRPINEIRTSPHVVRSIGEAAFP